MASIPRIPTILPSPDDQRQLPPAALRGKRGRKNSNELQINDDRCLCRLSALPACQIYSHGRQNHSLSIWSDRSRGKKLAFKITGKCFRFTAWNSWAVGNNLPGVRLLFSHKYLSFQWGKSPLENILCPRWPSLEIHNHDISSSIGMNARHSWKLPFCHSDVMLRTSFTAIARKQRE